MTDDNLSDIQNQLSRRGLLKAVGAIAVLTSTSGLLAACTSGGANGSGSASPNASGIAGPTSDAQLDTLGWALPSSIPTLDVAKDFRDPTLTAASLTLEPLVVVDTDLKLQPWLATLSQPSPTSLVFTLRDGVKFTDGTPLTPADVVWSIQRHLDPKLASQLSYFLGSFESVQQTGSNEVTITLKGPDPAFAYLLVFVGIHSKAFGEKAGDKLGSPDVGVLGTGQYVLSAHKPDAGITGTRNDNYWGTKPKIRVVNLQVISNPDTMRLAMQSGSVSGTFNPSLALARQFRSTPNIIWGEVNNSTSTFLTFPVRKTPFDDVHVRKAFAHCFDRAGLVKALLDGGGTPASSVSAPNQWTPLLGTDCAKQFLASLPAYSFSIDDAKKELSQSAHASGFTCSTSVPSDDPELNKIALSLEQNLKQIGITLEVKQISSDTYNQQVFTDKVEALWLTRLNPVVPDPTDYLGIILPTSASEPGGYNFAYYSNAEVDALLKSQQGAEGQARIDMLKKIATIAQNELPYAPIYWPNYALALNNAIRFIGLNQISGAIPWAQNIGKPA